MHSTQGLSLKLIIFYIIIGVIATISIFFLIFKPNKRMIIEDKIEEKKGEIEDSNNTIEELKNSEKENIKEISQENVSVEDALKYLKEFLK